MNYSTGLETLPSEAQIHQAISDELRTAMSGGVVLQSEESYAEARRVWNGAVSHRPAIIAFCERIADVEASVRVARRYELPLSVRGGGHDWAGRALRHNGLTIDLTRMRGVIIDPDRRVATVGGGARIKDVAEVAAAHGLMAALGNCGTVGIAGLTLGGGYGPFNGQFGLAADNLLSAELVLADGQRVIADADHEPDLFWALRGGGGNFGVVTSLQIRLHESRRLLAGSIVYPWGEAEQILRRYALLTATTPDELGVTIMMASGPDGQPALMLVPLWNGEKQEGERMMRDLQALGTPQLAQIGPMTYPDVLAPIDAMVEAAADVHWEFRTRSLPSLTPGALAAIMEAVSHKTSLHSMVNWHHFHGAGTRISSDAAAFGERREHFMVEIIAGWKPDGDDGSTHRQWAQDLWQNLAPFALPGGYANLLAPHEQEQARYAYGNNGARLKALKHRFDPDGMFSSAIPLPGRQE